MGSASKDDLSEQLAALFRRLCSRPAPPDLLDLVDQLEAAFPAMREPVLDRA